jgi:lipid-A-disaccharide synthase
MTGLAQTPMVIMYKMNAMTGFVARRLVKGNFFGMANLILGEGVCPEFFQGAANSENLAAAIVKFMDDPGLRKNIKEKLSHIKDKLGNGGAVNRVVDNLSELLERSGSPA